jgi:hypothetical protein
VAASGAGRPREAAPAPPAGGLSAEALEARRQEILAERKKKQAPVQKAADPERAREMHTKGLEQLAAGNPVGAAQSFKLAMTYDPGNIDYKRLYEEAESGAGLARARRLAEQAEDQARLGKAMVAGQGFAQALELSPAKVSYAVRAAEEFLAARELERAWEFAQKAVALSPKRADTRLVAARVLEARGDRAGAQEQLGALSGLEREDPRVKELWIRLMKG